MQKDSVSKFFEAYAANYVNTVCMTTNGLILRQQKGHCIHTDLYTHTHTHTQIHTRTLTSCTFAVARGGCCLHTVETAKDKAMATHSRHYTRTWIVHI